ncbi:hypothetical protein F441_13311 [Phytophthora nicotianae CJ01A1]|uniref:Uncharacterized protein n=3 Tax=Phytophthora nicotianae TaxID=4792 RepID=W2WM10_PHYNI|nr:hypothetical protein L914_12865 [Phytophthora nicotianae]ETP11168.1 hypothetical protein F441_13311 [Phytophthora nicotianae CJ01A1]
MIYKSKSSFIDFYNSRTVEGKELTHLPMANLDRSKRSRLGLTKAEYRTNYMMRTAKLSMSTKVTPDLCDSMAAHTLRFHVRALDLRDMPVDS